MNYNIVAHRYSSTSGIIPNVDLLPHIGLPRAGSWGTPEFGLTEAIGGLLNKPRNNQGGSNVLGASSKASSGLTPNTKNSLSNISFGTQPGVNLQQAYASGGLVPGNGGSVLGASTSGGSGGSGGGDGGGSNPYYDQGTGITFPSYEAFAGEVNNLFGESEGILNRTEADTRAREGDYYTTASAPFEAQKPILSQARDEGLQLNAKQKAEEQLREQDALARARRLFQELTQGTRQRFGGSSSAGEFANQILGREHMKNISSVQDTAGQNYANLYDKAQNIQKQYATQLQSIEKEKEGAIAQARLMFQEKIDNINNSRLALSQNKAQMKLAELQNLRNTVLNIQQQAQQYKQSIQSAIANTQAQLQAQIQGYKAQSGQAVNMNAIPNAMMSAYGGSQGANFLSNPIGNIGLRDEDRQRLGF